MQDRRKDDLFINDLFRVIPMGIPMEIEPEVVDMRSEEEKYTRKEEKPVWRNEKGEIVRPFFENRGINGYSLKDVPLKGGEEGIQRYPKFERSKDGYLIGLGHVWKPVTKYVPGELKENYLYYGDQLFVRMK